jgi:hypothetical protein
MIQCDLLVPRLGASDFAPVDWNADCGVILNILLGGQTGYVT